MYGSAVAPVGIRSAFDADRRSRPPEAHIPRMAPSAPTLTRKSSSHCETALRAPILNDMKYRGMEYSVVQGIGRHVWKWSVSLDTGVSVGGRTATKSEALAEAERAIDRALAPKKLRIVPPKTER
jgi:hypothetical protein